MTLALRELQAAFADHLLAGPRPDLVAAIVGGRLPAEARLRIHRHHVLTSLAKVLEATFPTVSRLVGEDFFAGMARAFIVAEPPAQPVLAEYGKGFAAFIDTYAPAQGLPYLADMARLEMAWTIVPAALLLYIAIAQVETWADVKYVSRMPQAGGRVTRCLHDDLDVR